MHPEPVPATAPPRRGRRRWAALLLASLPLAPALAFETLNDAQRLLYERAHLASSAAGDVVDYRYSARLGDAEPIEDTARLHIDAEPEAERRDVTLEFLSDARRLALPPFEGYRTNPVLIAMLEHLVQSMSVSSGGGALYFRNRVRDALAREDTRVEHGETALGEDLVPSTTLAFEPFRNDPYLGADPAYAGATFRIVLSEAVPGGVVSIGARSGQGAAADAFDYRLRIADGEQSTER